MNLENLERTSSKMIKKLTVCIVTYKREAGLAKLLAELAKQTFTNFDVIITDNAKESNVENVVKNSTLSISLFNEPRQGVVYARNKCLEEFLKTDSDALVWIDDDEWPEYENWLEELIVAHDLTKSDIITSDVISHPEDYSIKFLERALYAKDYSVKDYVELSKFYTGNTLIMRSVVEKVGFFDLDFNLTGSEDLDYCTRSGKLGFKAVYAKNAKVIELHPKSRSSLKWFALRGFRVGQGSTLVSVKNKGLTRTLLLLIPYAGYRFLDAIMILSKSLITLDKSKLYAGVLRLGSSLGTISGIFGFKYKEYKKK